ncbi:hypothetical protein C8F04DRAFT_1274931 [Mycena alexandri]|uniref:Uncharacterized protein n=1 Tax=Mycena alexandri TaxID=1745969 RepID=A0AAD6WN27_9AGAR|nr:hypothetical protein C8F04DRAFT_1274931 [Mycena alexandri]
MNRGGRPRANALECADVSFFNEDGDTTVAADRGVYFSTDGQRRREELLNITHKKRRLEPTQPAQLDDPLASWIPVPEDHVEPMAGEEVDREDDNFVLWHKRKHYDNSSDPMGNWRPQKQEFMDALLWHEGLGDHGE